MKDETTLLLEMYRIQVSRSEHFENLRSSVTNMVLALSAAFTAVAFFDSQLEAVDGWVGGAVIVVGLFGFAASRLHGERARRHGKRAAEYRNALDRLLPEARINAIRDLVPRAKTRLDQIWSGLHLGLAALGAVLLVLALAG